MFHVTFFNLSHLILVGKMKTNWVTSFLRTVTILTNICARTRKVTLKIATPNRSKKIVGCVCLSIRKWILFLKFLESNSSLKFYILGMSPCSTLKFSICDICNLFCAILVQHFTHSLFRLYVNSIQYDHLITVERKIWLWFYTKEIYVIYWKN